MHGALIGPAPTVSCEDFHCSPLLLSPKDGDKRQVILNLSLPKGGSLNDNVDRAKFDGRQFTLRFPVINDIVEKILKNPEDTLTFKIDVAHAFRNLRADPADALKFGISWVNNYYLDLGIAFGCIHGSSTFQMVIDVITHVMAKHNCKV